MAAGFYADVPDLHLVCDGLRIAGDQLVCLWTFTGSHAASGNPLRIVGWEEWDVDAHHRTLGPHGDVAGKLVLAIEG